jgi:hypothetical protein
MGARMAQSDSVTKFQALVNIRALNIKLGGERPFSTRPESARSLNLQSYHFAGDRSPKPSRNADESHSRTKAWAATHGGQMGRFVAAALTLVLVTPVLLLPAASQGSDRTLPMHFSLHVQGPGESCAPKCRTLISASGAITANTAQDFKAFARDRDLTGAIVVLDSNGGSVHGAIALGREIRRLGLDTTVGRLADLGAHHGTQRAKLIPRADCESMCAFVLVAGVHRTVPSEARVMVHQIWLGDRRDDPAAANYSAEDLVLVQRDIGRLARYTADMGASIELLDLALRIPPWEPMHALTRAEIRRTRKDRRLAWRVRGTAGAAHDQWRAHNGNHDQQAALGHDRSRRY